ncbi:ATP-dependent nuclease, partial [Psychrobacter celer]|uniref:ATP-dependent nuclease n=1 Tax=Psychrobacter celer TaxID=306572 RepID=UPI003FD20DB8
DIQQFTCNDSIEAQLNYSHTTKSITYKYKKNGRFINAPIELMQNIRNYITFVYIPPNRNEEQLIWQENSLMKQLIEEFLKQETKNRDTITPKFTKATDFLEKNALKKISKEIEACYSLRHKFEFSLNFDNQANFLSFLSEIQMYINEAGIKHNLKDCGTGLQSLTIIAFHRVLAKIQHKNIVLGLEEPEINLHPQAQRELIKSIKLSSNDNDISQVIVTTHSTVIIDNIDHTNILLVRKKPDEKRGFKSTITKTSDNFFTKHNLEEFKYYQFHSYRNSDFFFANYVIFVESKNDAEVVKHLAKQEGIDLDLHGISLVNVDGVKNLPYPYRIVKELGIPHLIILDKDYFLPYLNDKLDDSRNDRG